MTKRSVVRFGYNGVWLSNLLTASHCLSILSPACKPWLPVVNHNNDSYIKFDIHNLIVGLKLRITGRSRDLPSAFWSALQRTVN